MIISGYWDFFSGGYNGGIGTAWYESGHQQATVFLQESCCTKDKAMEILNETGPVIGLEKLKVHALIPRPLLAANSKARRVLRFKRRCPSASSTTSECVARALFFLLSFVALWTLGKLASIVQGLCVLTSLSLIFLYATHRHLLEFTRDATHPTSVIHRPVPKHQRCLVQI